MAWLKPTCSAIFGREGLDVATRPFLAIRYAARRSHHVCLPDVSQLRWREKHIRRNRRFGRERRSEPVVRVRGAAHQRRRVDGDGDQQDLERFDQQRVAGEFLSTIDGQGLQLQRRQPDRHPASTRSGRDANRFQRDLPGELGDPSGDSPSAPPSITASPNPIPVAAGVTVGQTTISWSAPGSTSVELHVGGAAVPLFAEGLSAGSAQTGNWVNRRYAVYLVDGVTRATLAGTTVAVHSPGETAAITALPIPVHSALLSGRTTVSWNAPGSTAVEVHVGSAAGPIFASGGPVGAAETGDWVSNGMVFVLVDAATHTQLATTSVSLGGT